MRLKNIFAAAVLVLLTAGGLSARQDEGIAAVKSRDGFVLVWNQPDDYFTLEVKGKDVRAMNSTQHVFFNVDGVPLQVLSVGVNTFFKGDAKAEAGPQAILAAYRDWESQYIEGTLGRKLNVTSSALKLKGGAEALLWKYDMPEGLNADAKQQLYLTVVNGKNVLGLNGVVVTGQKEEAVRQLLVSTMETLKKSATPVSLKELQKSLRGEAPL